MNSSLASMLGDFFAEPHSEARRILHGRGKCYAGLEQLSIDWFPPLVLIGCYDADIDVGEIAACCKSMDQHNQIDSVIVQARHRHGAPSEAQLGTIPDSLVVEENGLRFEVRPGRKQNAGLFLDMRPLRDWLRDNCAEKNVLNLFAYTCSLSVAALAGGARAVTSVDMSKSSIAWGARNHLLNGQSLDRVKEIPHNLFRSWGRVAQFGRYDLVLIDPPTRQRGSFDAAKDYASVIRRMPKLCNPGASIVAALNSPFLGEEFLIDSFRKHLPTSELVERLPAAPEFVDIDPQRGLKICLFHYPGDS